MGRITPWPDCWVPHTPGWLSIKPEPQIKIFKMDLGRRLEYLVFVVFFSLSFPLWSYWTNLPFHFSLFCIQPAYWGQLVAPAEVGSSVLKLWQQDQCWQICKSMRNLPGSWCYVSSNLAALTKWVKDFLSWYKKPQAFLFRRFSWPITESPSFRPVHYTSGVKLP